MGNEKFVVRSLTCKRDVDMAVVCYKSFVDCYNQNIKLIIHSDGSLTSDDISKLYNSLENVEIIDRKDTEEEVREVLSKYPNCLNFRNVHPLSTKILDIPIIEKKCIRFIDCDILFIKKFDDLFSDDCSSRFCLEDDTGYSGRLIDMMKASKNKIPKRCNAGIIQMDKTKFDLEYIEWFLSKKHLCNFPGMLDQTLYAILMGWKDSYNFAYKQISTSKRKISISKDTIAIHFMYDLKRSFFEFAEKFKNVKDDNISHFRLYKPERLSYPYIIKRAVGRKFQAS